MKKKKKTDLHHSSVSWILLCTMTHTLDCNKLQTLVFLFDLLWCFFFIRFIILRSVMGIQWRCIVIIGVFFFLRFQCWFRHFSKTKIGLKVDLAQAKNKISFGAQKLFLHFTSKKFVPKLSFLSNSSTTSRVMLVFFYKSALSRNHFVILMVCL